MILSWRHRTMRGAIRMAMILAALPLFGQSTGSSTASSLPPIRVVCDDSYPPYSFRSDSGEVQGIIPDLWKAFSAQTGRAVEFRAMDWALAQREMSEGHADVLDSAFSTPERQRVYDFLPAYATLRVPVFFHRSISGIAEPRDLRGFRVAVKLGDACVSMLQGYGIKDLMQYASYEAIIKAAKAGDVRVMCIDEPPALYYLYKYGLEDEFKGSFNLYTGYFHRAVHKDRKPLADGADLYTVLEKGFAGIPAGTLKSIEERWLGKPLSSRLDWRIALGVGLGILGLVAVLIAFLVTLRLQVRKKTVELREKNTELNANSIQLQKSLDEKEILLKEIHHRVKNNLQVVSSLVQLQSSVLKSEHDRQLFEETQHRILAMAQVHELLYRSDNLSSIDGAEYVRLVYDELQYAYQNSVAAVQANLSLEPVPLDLDTAIPLALILNEALSNAFKYAFDGGRNGRLEVSLKHRPDGKRVLVVADDGPGFKEGWQLHTGDSLGLTLIQSLSAQVKGTLVMENRGGAYMELVF